MPSQFNLRNSLRLARSLSRRTSFSLVCLWHRAGHSTKRPRRFSVSYFSPLSIFSIILPSLLCHTGSESDSIPDLFPLACSAMEMALQYFPFTLVLCSLVILVPISLVHCDVAIYCRPCLQTQQFVPSAWSVIQILAHIST